MDKHNVIGIDLAKRIFQVGKFNSTRNQMLFNKQVKRKDLLKLLSKQPSCRVVMEGCAGVHYWYRQISRLGHEVVIISPQYVSPYRQGQKDDRNDVVAIIEAGLRPQLRYVTPKTIAQQDIQSLHRVRDRLGKQLRALMNQLHGLLHEYGIVSRCGHRALIRSVHEALEDGENELTSLMREVLLEQLDELQAITTRHKAMDDRIVALSRQLEPCRALVKVEGVGPIIATRLYSVLGNGHAFKRGREASAYLGLTPRHHGTGGKVTLLGISRNCADPQLRAHLIRGAHAVIQRRATKRDAKSRWLHALVARVGKNKAAVALANKTVRCAWAMLSTGQAYELTKQTQRVSPYPT